MARLIEFVKVVWEQIVAIFEPSSGGARPVYCKLECTRRWFFISVDEIALQKVVVSIDTLRLELSTSAEGSFSDTLYSYEWT